MGSQSGLYLEPQSSGCLARSDNLASVEPSLFLFSILFELGGRILNLKSASGIFYNTLVYAVMFEVSLQRGVDLTVSQSYQDNHILCVQVKNAKKKSTPVT